MSDRCLILVGLSDSCSLLTDYCERWPRSIVWTMCRGYIPGTSARHFEIHHDRRLNRQAVEQAKADGVPVVISPFHVTADPREETFPLASMVETFGHAYYELSSDYLLAYAAREYLAGRLEIDRVILLGQEFDDSVHFVSRGGATYWKGWFDAKGIRLETTPGCNLLKRKTEVLRQIMPFHGWVSPIYGQPEELAVPFLKGSGVAY